MSSTLVPYSPHQYLVQLEAGFLTWVSQLLNSNIEYFFSKSEEWSSSMKFFVCGPAKEIPQ